VRVAAVDVGTNTVRLLVADVDGPDVRPVERGREITRLGQGIDASRRFAPEAVDRTIAVVEAFVEHARRAGAERVRIAGTSAVRDAGDRDAFLTHVHERTGLEMDVLTGDDEGRLSYLGATFELDAGAYVVCDIGGGSTELSTSETSVSLDVGSVRLKERCLHTDPPTPSEIDHARTVIDDALDGVALPGDLRLIGVAGTITTLASVVLGLRAYDHDVVHRSMLGAADVAAWSDRLLSMTADDIVALGPVERGRADVIGGGSLILRRVMERWSFVSVLVSERDILDGLVLALSVA
jgi:exopolyphosphatase / guanosine-5'-triphosphate,3'-diphosphate pyrophosphatase